MNYIIKLSKNKYYNKFYNGSVRENASRLSKKNAFNTLAKLREIYKEAIVEII